MMPKPAVARHAAAANEFRTMVDVIIGLFCRLFPVIDVAVVLALKVVDIYSAVVHGSWRKIFVKLRVFNYEQRRWGFPEGAEVIVSDQNE